jgi:hypothetical protein
MDVLIPNLFEFFACFTSLTFFKLNLLAEGYIIYLKLFYF